MKQDEAEKLARCAASMDGDAMLRLALSGKEWRSLCDYILSGDMKREIENAAYELAGVQFDRLGCIEAAKTVRSLIQPPAQKENGK